MSTEIKTLEWKKIVPGYTTKRREYRTLDDRFQIVNRSRYSGDYYSVYELGVKNSLIGYYPTLAEAKAAAQARYDQKAAS